MLLLLMTCCLPTYANEQDIVNSFTNFTNKILSEIRASYAREDYYVNFHKETIEDKRDGIRGNYWYKMGYSDLRSSIDIRKTDSLMTPYEGYLILGNSTVRYYSPNNTIGEYQTRQEAELAKLKKVTFDEYEYKFVYAYQNGQWVLKALFWRDPNITNGLWEVTELGNPLDMYIAD